LPKLDFCNFNFRHKNNKTFPPKALARKPKKKEGNIAKTGNGNKSIEKYADEHVGKLGSRFECVYVPTLKSTGQI